MDTDKLIQAIHAQNALWEIGSKEYMNINIKKKSWAEVGSLMYPDWNNKEQLEKDEAGNYNYYILFNYILYIICKIFLLYVLVKLYSFVYQLAQ